MAATTTGLLLRPALRRMASQTADARREAEPISAESAAPPADAPPFGDADYHLLRSHALLERLDAAIATRQTP